MTRQYFDTNGQALDPELISTPEAAPAIDPAVAAELDAIAAEGQRIADRFQELAGKEYWQDIEVVAMYMRMAEQFEQHGQDKPAEIYRTIARSVAVSVDEQRAEIYAQIKQEMSDDG